MRHQRAPPLPSPFPPLRMFIVSLHRSHDIDCNLGRMVSEDAQVHVARVLGPTALERISGHTPRLHLWLECTSQADAGAILGLHTAETAQTRRTRQQTPHLTGADLCWTLNRSICNQSRQRNRLGPLSLSETVSIRCFGGLISNSAVRVPADRSPGASGPRVPACSVLRHDGAAGGAIVVWWQMDYR